MIRQYGAQRARGGRNPLRVGTIPVGAIFYLQSHDYTLNRHGPRATLRNPWIVEGFTNGLLCAARFDRSAHRWVDSYWSGRSDMALVRSLRDGRHGTVAVRVLLMHEELGLTKGEVEYPSLPDTDRFYRRQHHPSVVRRRHAA